MFKQLHYKQVFLLVLVLCCTGLQLKAAKRYWVSAATAGWNSTANWSSTSGGAGGSSVPGSSDTCYFDGNGLGRCDINANVNVKRFEIVSTYNDTITQNAFTITVGSGGMKLAGAAVFIGSSSSITLSGTLENTACKFTSTSGTFEIKEGHFTLSGTGSFLHNNGLVKFYHGAIVGIDTCRITLSTSSSDKYFYDVEMNSPSTWHRYYKFPSGNMRVNHLLTTAGDGNKYIIGTIELMGDYTYAAGTVSGGNLTAGTLKFIGTGDQTLTGNGSSGFTKVVNIDIDKSSGTLYLAGTIATAFELKRTNGNINAGTSRFYFGSVLNGTKITGNFTRSNSLNKLYFIGSSGSLTIDDTLQVNDSLVFSRSVPLNKGTNAGILCAKGHINIAGNFLVTGTMTLLVSGSGKQVYKSGVIYDLNRLQGSPNIKIEKGLTDTLKMEGFHPIQTAFTYVSGVVNSDNARIKFSAANLPVITGSVTLKNVEFCYGSSIATNSITIASGTQLTVGDSLMISGTGGSSNLLSTGTVNMKGNMYISCTSTGNAGNATIKINGTGNQHIYGFTGSGTQGRLPNMEINKTSGTLYLHNNICTGSSGTANTFTHTQGTIDYGTSTLIFANNCNITSSIAGNRLELYNVQFTTGTVSIQGSTTLVANNELSTSASSSALTINGNVLECKGNITINNTNTSIASAGTVSMLINGTGNQVFTGSGVSATGFLPKITINKTGGTLYLASIISAGNDWTYTAGNVDAATYTGKVYFGGTHNIDAQGTAATMNFYDATFAGASTLTGDANVRNNLVINSSSTLTQGSYALGFGGYTNNGTHSGTGAVTLTGSGYHTFTRSGGGTTNFGTVTVNRSGGSLTLASPVNITASLSFTKGVIKTTSSNLLKFADNATCSGGSDSGYVHGPLQKTGNDAFFFPLGDTAVSGSGKYHPVKITAPSSATDAFTAQYFSSGQTLGAAVDTLAIDSLNSCQRWTVSRDAGTSLVKVSVTWNNDCGLSADAGDMRLAQWDGSRWMSIGDEVTGRSVSSKNALNTFGTFTIAQSVCSVLQKVNPIRISGTAVQKSDAATSNGSVTLSVSGGTTPYTYSWSSGPTTASLSGLSAGIYSVTVTDAYSCKAKKYFFIGSKGATNTYTLTPDGLAGIDATVMKGQDGVSGTNSNYGTYTTTDAGHISDGTTYSTYRSFLRFDFSSLPLNTIVNSASLKLYGSGNNQSASTNRTLLKRVGDKWDENLLTWNNQPYTYEKDTIGIDSTNSYSRDYTVNVLQHVQKMVANPYGNNGWMLSLQTENSANPAMLSFGSSDNAYTGYNPGIVISITIPDDCDQNRNWVQTTTFGEEGEITSQSKSFMDNLGRSTQDQARVMSSELILASQTMYDDFGRPVGSTLPAPTYTNSLCFKTNFILDDSSNAYTYNDFDKTATGSNLPGEIFNPKGVDNSTQGTVGWYYSNNNTEEPFVAATSFPYSRVQYSNDPTGRVWKSSGVDTMFRMGSGHETKTFTMPSAGELDYLFGYRGTYNQSESFGSVNEYKSENLLVYKTLSVNADGKEAVAYTNSSGQLIASCVSGSGGACDVQEVYQPIRYFERGYTTLHIPKSQNNSVELPISCVTCITNDPVSGGNYGFGVLMGDATGDIRILYKLQNAETGTFLVEGTDYTLNRTTRKLTFINDYDSTSLVLNVAYDVPQAYKYQLFLAAPPEISFKYKMDYNQWSLNYYDLKGRLASTVAPNDINCSDYFQGGTFHVETYKTEYAYLACVASTNTSARAFETHPADYASPGMKQNVAITLYPSYEDPGLNSRYISPPDTLLFNRSLPVSSFGRFADSTAVIDTTILRGLSLEWLNNDVHKTYVEPVYADSIIVYDSTGVTPVDTLPDSLATRLMTPGQYLEFKLIADIGYKTTVGGNFIYQHQEDTLTYRLSYDYQLGNYNIIPDPDNTLNYFVPQSVVDTIEDIGIKFRAKSVRFVGYGAIDPTVQYALCTWPFVTTPPASTISQTLWNNVIYTYTYYLRLNYKAVINNYYTDVAPQVATTQIKYDDYNRVVQTISPDEGQSDVIYDDEGKVRFTQNDLQRMASNGGRFSYVNYDKRGRVVENGEYDPNIPDGSSTKLWFQTQAQFDAGVHTAPSGSGSLIWIKNLPVEAIYNPRKKEKSGVIYDLPPGDTPPVTGASPAYNQRNVHGRIAKAWNEKGATWYSYDERGGLTWTVQDITGLGTKTYNYVTSLFGKLEQTQYQKENNSERLFHKYEYDADARLTASWASTNGGFSWEPLTNNEYYQHGPLKRMMLGHKLQGLDYVYTVSGALKSINDPYLSAADPGGDGIGGSTVNADVFGYSIDYYPDDYKREGTGIQTYNGSNFGGDNNSYAGIIKSVRWRTVLPAGATNNYGTSTLMQEYNYDFNYQLTDALFTPVAHNSGSVPSNTVQPAPHHDPSHGHYSYAYGVSDITYDLNGNIQTLKRNPYVALDAGVSPSDNLTYHYSSALKNRLLYVGDAAGTSTGTETDFPNQSSGNYSYDAIGQLTTDTKDGLTYEYYSDGLTKNIRQGGVIRAAFEYNHLGLRQRKITYAGGEPTTYTWYVYDPAGALVSTYSTDIGNDTTIQEDMPLYAGGRVGMLNKGTGRYSFELTDHLGNVRSVIAKASGSNAVEVLSYSDYYPHGGILPGRNYVSSPAYKIGAAGVEKDGETNFLNFELRQMDSRLGRWFNPDPMGQYFSPYLAMGNNPVSMIDEDGGYSVMGGAFGDMPMDNYIDGMEYYKGNGGGWNAMTPFDRQITQGLNHTSYGWQRADRVLDYASMAGSYHDGHGTNVVMDSQGRGYWADNNYVKGDVLHVTSTLMLSQSTMINYREYGINDAISDYVSGLGKGWVQGWDNMVEGLSNPGKGLTALANMSFEERLEFTGNFMLDELSKYSTFLKPIHDAKMQAEGEALVRQTGDMSNFSVPQGERLFDVTTDAVSAAGTFGMAKVGPKVSAALAKANQAALKATAKVVAKTLNKGKNSIFVKKAGKTATRYDLMGKAHAGVETPHKQLYKFNQNPKTGAASYSRASKEAFSMGWGDMMKVIGSALGL
jgi:RHS repeat-associated protein